MIDIYLIACMAAFDRARGDSFDFFGNRWGDRVMYAWTTSVLLGHAVDWLTPVLIITLSIGMMPGWGKPIGDILNPANKATHYEYWQLGVLKKPIPALVFRGFIWGLPTAVLAILIDDLSLLSVLIAYTISLPSAVLISKKVRKSWECQELVRGCLAGLIIVILR